MSVDIEEIKRLFAEEFPVAAEAIVSGGSGDRLQALAMYEAFKKGYLRGRG